MICQECNKRPATLHFTKIVNGDKTEIHICEHCAKGKSEMMFSGNSGFSINNLLAGLLNIEPSITKSEQSAFHENEILQCEKCKMTYPQFAKIGRFGCSHCYKTFENQLNPLLKRVHSGNTNHNGKIPRRIGGSIHLRKQIKELKETLQQYVLNEEFERAAETRDKLRELEKSLSSQREEEH